MLQGAVEQLAGAKLERAVRPVSRRNRKKCEGLLELRRKNREIAPRLHL
jgi:hypothetical protein